jgi:ankyrin repeat protein
MNDDNPVKQFRSAIKNNNIAAVSSLIASGAVNANGTPWPLHCAAKLGHVAIMRLLLDAGADIDANDENRERACHVAVFHSQFDALKLLVERGADLGCVNGIGVSLLATAAHYGKAEEMIILLLDAGAPFDQLESSNLFSLVSSVAVFERLLARGVDLIAMRDENGATLCHYLTRCVVRDDDFRVLAHACVALINAVDRGGSTPLHWAVTRGSESVVRVLVELGTDVDRQNTDGWTALHRACDDLQLNGPSVVELLVVLGADVSLVDCADQSVCDLAAAHWHSALCICVAAGGDLDRTQKTGDTPRRIANRYNTLLPCGDEIAAARRRIAKARLDLVRQRAIQICVGLQSLDIDALRLCEILMHSFGALGSLIAFHQWWQIATKVKHFHAIRL